MRDGSHPLVSVVTPCHNGEAFLDRYFACLTAQTYPAIEIILVDDGSDDRTPQVVRAHAKEVEARGYRLVYLRQEHRGQAAAINRGLARVSGDYVSWPDSDDLMRPDNVERKVRLLESRPDLGFACCQVNVVDERDLGRPRVVRRVRDTSDPWLFDRIIRDDGAFCLDIAYLARTEALFGALGGRRIVESPAGQNYQLLLPLAWSYPCGFIDEPLVSYVTRAGSHSRSFTTPAQRLERAGEFEELLHAVLDTIPMDEERREAYARYVDVKFLPQRFEAAVELGDRELARRAKAALDAACGPSALREAMSWACGAGCGRLAARAAGLYRAARSRAARALGRTHD